MTHVYTRSELRRFSHLRCECGREVIAGTLESVAQEAIDRAEALQKAALQNVWVLHARTDGVAVCPHCSEHLGDPGSTHDGAGFDGKVTILCPRCQVRTVFKREVEVYYTALGTTARDGGAR